MANQKNGKKIKLGTKHQFERGVAAFLKKDYNLGIQQFKIVLETDPEDAAAKFYLQESSQKMVVVA